MSNQDTPPIKPSVATLASRGIQPRFGELVQARVVDSLDLHTFTEPMTG